MASSVAGGNSYYSPRIAHLASKIDFAYEYRHCFEHRYHANKALIEGIDAAADCRRRDILSIMPFRYLF